MLAADLLLRWIHIFGAIMLVGGTIFMRCAFHPAVTAVADASVGELVTGVRSRWAKLVMVASGLLLVGGIINLVLILQRYEIDDQIPGRLYHMVFGIKFLLALIIFFLSAALSGRSKLAEKLRQKESTWLTVNLVLAVIVVCLAGVMKMSGRTPKSTSSADRSPPVAVQRWLG